MTSATRRRRLLGALALALILVVAVVVFARGSSDDYELTVTNGADVAGFPLRGDLARDSTAIRAAAEGWLADDAREDEDNQVLDHDDDVELRALWAGRLHGRTAVILAADRDAALLELGSGDEFDVKDVQPIRAADQPAVVTFDEAVLVDARADPVFMTAGARENDVGPLDGLWTTTGKHAGSGLPDGVLVLRGGMLRFGSTRDRTGPVAVVVSDHSSVWLVDAALQAKLMPGTETFPPPAYQRFVAATSFAAVDGQTQWERSFHPPEVRLVQDRTLPVLGPTMVLTAERRSGRDRMLAAHGGSTVAGKDEAEPLDLGNDGNDGYGARSSDGPAFAAALVDRATELLPDLAPAVLVAGSAEIETIEVLTGRGRLTRRGPVAVITLPEVTGEPASKPPAYGDFAVLGRTRDGTVVVPRSVRDN
jgi:hypothetical protein